MSATNASLPINPRLHVPPRDIVAVDTVHFFSDDSNTERIAALKSYGCSVLLHAVDADPRDVGGSGVIVIDLPQLSKSFSLCRQLRAEGIDLPLVTITASSDPFDEVLGLELGADEVVDKGIHSRVLLARLRAISRRAEGTRPAIPPEKLTFGNLRIDGANREVTLHGERIAIASGEFELLLLLARNAGHVMRRDDVLQKLRGLTESDTNRSVDARLYRLRRRFGDVPGIAARIKTVRPYGYMFVNMPW